MMDASSEEEYNTFLEKVKRTIYVDNLAPQVTEPVIRTAFSQFGEVKSIQFIPIYLEPENAPKAVLLEMDSPKLATKIISEMRAFPLMILGMPRPVRALAARVEMFEERPRKPGRKIICQWFDPEDPKYEAATELKHAVRRHAAQASVVLEEQRSDEEKLSNQHDEMLKAQHKKLELLNGVFEDGTFRELACHYDMRFVDA